jgi:hypothetical protein
MLIFGPVILNDDLLYVVMPHDIEMIIIKPVALNASRSSYYTALQPKYCTFYDYYLILLSTMSLKKVRSAGRLWFTSRQRQCSSLRIRDQAGCKVHPASCPVGNVVSTRRLKATVARS